MSDVGAHGGASVPVEVNLSQDSLDALGKKLASALEKGMVAGTKAMEKQFSKFLTTMNAKFAESARTSSATWTKNFKLNTSGMETAIKRASEGVSKALGMGVADMGVKASEALRQSSSLLGRLTSTKNMQMMSTNPLAVRAAGQLTNLATSGNYNATIDLQSNLKTLAAEKAKEQEIIRQAGKLKVQEEANAGRLQGIEARKTADILVRQSRTAAEARLAVQKTLLKSLVIVERTIVAGVTGLAKTATSVISRLASGTSSLLGKMASGIGSIFHRHNDDFTEGLQGSLTKREQIISRSMSRETEVVSRAQARQAAQIAELRTASQTGVVGGLSRNLLAGIGGGFAAFSAIRSTFNVGSEFVRGLAVLQTQLGLTADQMVNVRKVSIQLGNDISLPGVSALDAAQAIQILTKQFGYLGPAAVEAATQAAKGTLQLSRATGASAEEAAAVIGSAVNVFHVAAKDAVDVADSVAVALSKAAGVSFEDFANSFSQGAAVFEQFVGPAESAKKVLDEFSTSLAILARSGLTGETAGAGLKQFFLQGSRTGPKISGVVDDLVARAGQTGTIFYDATGSARKFGDAIDILRKGLAGMGDAEKNATLQTLFGSRSITIANALINTSAEEYNSLRDAMYRQGAAAAIAAAQNKGLKGAMDALKSVVETTQIIFYEKFSPLLGKVVLQIASLTNEVLFSNGPWTIFRQAVEGAAIALGAVIAAKGAVQVVELLGKAAKIAMGPFGLFLLGISAVGAVLSVMLQRSAALRETLKLLGARFAEIGDKIRTAVAPYLKLAGDFIDTTLIPAVDRLAKWLADHLLGAFDATVRFIQNTLIPGFKSFVGYLEANVFPVIGKVAGVIGTGFIVGLHAVQDFAAKVYPYLKPAIEGFKILGSAIASAFGGDFSKIGSGLGAAGSGILSSLSAIGSKVLELLKPIGASIWKWVQETFSGHNLERLAGGFLDFVEWLGKALGSIVSSPTFVKAVAAVGAAAVIIGARFVEGFAKGVISNLPKLWALITSAFGSGLITLFKAMAENVGTTFLIALGAFVVGPKLISLFRGTGATAGQGFFKGIESQFAQFRDRLSVGSTIFKLWGSAIVDAGRQFSVLRLNGESAVGSLRQTFSKLWTDLKTAAAAGGTTIGQVLGSAIRAGVTVALGAVAGLQAGKAEGQSGGSGIMSALMVGLGVGAINPIAGVVAGGAALIGAAMGRSSKAAQEAAQRMSDLASTVKDLLAPAVEKGATSFDDLHAAISGREASGSMTDAINKALTGKTKQALLNLGISGKQIEAAFLQGGDAVKTLVDRLEDLKGNGLDSSITNKYTKAGDEIAAAWKTVSKQIKQAQTDALFKDAGMGPGAHASVSGIVESYVPVITSMEAVTQASADMKAELLKPLPIPGITDFTTAFDNAVLDLQGVGAQLSAALNLDGAVGSATQNRLKSQVATDIYAALQQGIVDGSIGSRDALQSQLDLLIQQAAVGGSPAAVAFLTNLESTLLPGLTDLFNKVPATLDSIIGATQNIWTVMGTNAAQGFLDGFNPGWLEVINTAKGNADDLAAAVANSLGIYSPSRVFMGIGENVSAGLRLGIESGADAAVAAAASMAGAASRAATGTWDMSTRSFADTMSRVGGLGATQQSDMPSGPLSYTDARQTHLHLPSGDPEANALAVANKQASPLWSS